MLERLSPNTIAPTPGYAGEQHALFRDYEGRGVLALNKVGAPRYAADPRTEVLFVHTPSTMGR
jgi:hypothetical protein